MSGLTVAPDAPRRKRALGAWAVFECDRRPSQAFIRTINAARRYPFDIGTPKRVIDAARDRKRGR